MNHRKSSLLSHCVRFLRWGPWGNPAISTETHWEKRITMCGGARKAGWHFSLDLSISRHRKEHGKKREQNRKEECRVHTQRPSAGKSGMCKCVCMTKVAFSQNPCCQISGIFLTVSSITSTFEPCLTFLKGIFYTHTHYNEMLRNN